MILVGLAHGLVVTLQVNSYFPLDLHGSGHPCQFQLRNYVYFCI